MGKMRINLMNALAEAGYTVDLVLGKHKGEHQLPLNPSIRVVRLGTTHAVFAAPSLALYLRRSRPKALLSQRIRVTVLAHRARALARVLTRIYATGDTHESRSVSSYPPREQRKRLARIRKYFARNDGMIAVSHGVAEDHAALMRWPVEAIHIIPNPVITPGIEELAREPVDHTWFQDDGPPVVLSIGRLAEPKDFPTLIRAFALFRQQHAARLVILGEGRLRGTLEALAREHGVAADIDMPGFADNVYAYLSRSRMLVMSSAWEGLGNVLIEAMAVGTPVVSTNCPSGPSEILKDGRLGPLAPVGDAAELARSMTEAWDDPVDPDTLRHSAHERYSVARSAASYIMAMGLDRTNERTNERNMKPARAGARQVRNRSI
ncbi:glycosyltransferase [Halofilum ochraceum]|uniref:glycosyltransferase n=1 Tax=Halofilum ochraceum TaxID=1611323 RepID=UPI001586D01F|nr:glycosyltransferase [Halofilum ochraceum]